MELQWDKTDAGKIMAAPLTGYQVASFKEDKVVVIRLEWPEGALQVALDGDMTLDLSDLLMRAFADVAEKKLKPS